MTTCPSGVNYMHLVDHARAYIQESYRRPWHERMLRNVLAWVLPHPGRFAIALDLAALGRPFARLFAAIPPLKPLAAMLALAPRHLLPMALAQPSAVPGAKGRVALLQGCAEPVLRPEFRAAAIRLLNRAGYDVAFAEGERCCGALVHHMGREDDSLAAARRNVDAWTREIEGGGLTAIVVTASGCGTTIKDYGFMLRGDPAYAEKAARVSALARDISELLIEADLPPGDGRGLTVAYHAACSLQHGQKVVDAPKRLLVAAGYTVRTPIEAHLCCGSAGTYNILQPDIAGQLGDRKAANIARLDADVVATGNVGCAMQIAPRLGIPVVHTIELIDWATGGPMPDRLSHVAPAQNG
jgi:glycolate oxidase iron-sulfur subunit